MNKERKWKKSHEKFCSHLVCTSPLSKSFTPSTVATKERIYFDSTLVYTTKYIISESQTDRFFVSS